MDLGIVVSAVAGQRLLAVCPDERRCARSTRHRGRAVVSCQTSFSVCCCYSFPMNYFSLVRCILFLMLALTDAQAANVAPLYTEFSLFDLPSIG